MTLTDEAALPFGVPLPPVPPRTTWNLSRAQDLNLPRTFEAGIPMRDGVELAADVHLPAAAGLPAPAIVTGTPYGKSSIDDLRPYRDAGYVAIEYDVRGRGKSEGQWNPLANDGPDGYDVVEWAAAQDWCNGEVGVSGLSYGGWVVWATIANKPPHLRAAVSTSAEGRHLEEFPYTHGCLWLYLAFWFCWVRRRINVLDHDLTELVKVLPVRSIGDIINVGGLGWQEWMDHDTLDDYWMQRRWDGHYDFDVPCLHVTGWHDREDIHGAFHHYEQMMATSPAKADQWLLVGPWSHFSSRHPEDQYAGVQYPGAALDMTAIHVRFFDRFLRGEHNGVDEEPHVRVYDPGLRHWTTRAAWKQGTVEHSLFLAPGHTLTTEPGPETVDEYVYDPTRPPGVWFDVQQIPWEPTLDLRGLQSRDGVLTWTGEVLSENLTLHGWGEVELWGATTCEDTDWHVKLADFDQDGQPLCVAWGCLRASYAPDPRAPTPVTPGAINRYVIELTPAFHTFQAGHRIQLVLASAEYPWFARNLNQPGRIADQVNPRVATNVVYGGSRWPSRVRLPVESSGATA